MYQLCVLSSELQVPVKIELRTGTGLLYIFVAFEGLLVFSRSTMGDCKSNFVFLRWAASANACGTN